MGKKKTYEETKKLKDKGVKKQTLKDIVVLKKHVSTLIRKVKKQPITEKEVNMIYTDLSKIECTLMRDQVEKMNSEITYDHKDYITEYTECEEEDDTYIYPTERLYISDGSGD